MTDEKLDQLLKQALTPEIDDRELKINRLEGERNMNHSENKKSGAKTWRYLPVAAASAAVFLLSSATVFAAWHYLSAKDLATENADERLAQEFEQNNWLDEHETQTYGDYDITLLGVVTGNKISDHLSKDDQGNIDGDKAYIAVAISHADGSPMPDTQSEEFDSAQFFVSPYIKGLNPVQYNACTLGGSFTCFVSEGIQYRLLETDNVECFADRGIYIGVSEGMAYNSQAYLYDETSGALKRNDSFEGVNALFVLPINPEKGDSGKAEKIIESMDNYEPGGEYTEVLSEADRWVNSISNKNIDTKAVPVESTRKTVSMEKFITSEFGDAPAPEGLDLKEIVMKEYFPNGTGMSETMTKYATTMEDAWVETYTLNEDGTVTYLRYVPE